MPVTPEGWNVALGRNGQGAGASYIIDEASQGAKPSAHVRPRLSRPFTSLLVHARPVPSFHVRSVCPRSSLPSSSPLRSGPAPRSFPRVAQLAPV